MRSQIGKTFLATAACVALATSAQAADILPPSQGDVFQQGLVLSGVFDLYGGFRKIKGDDDIENDSHGMFGGNAYASIPFGDVFSAQFDVQSEMYLDDTQDENPLGASMVGAHLSYRNPEILLLGVFAAGALPSAADVDEARFGWVAGPEAQLYIGDLTLYAQGGFGDIEVDDNPEGFSDGWFVRGVARYFFTEEFMLQGEYSYGETDSFIDGNDKGEFSNWGVKGVGRITDTYPIYGTLEYRGGHYDSTTEGDKGTDHAVLAGLSIRFGTHSLKHNDRYGAALDLPMLPVRAATWTEGLD